MQEKQQTVFHNRENRWQCFCCCLCMHQEGFQRKASQTLQYTDQPHYSINIKTWFYGLLKKNNLDFREFFIIIIFFFSFCYYFFNFITSLSLAGNADCLTWVRHSSCKSRATHFYHYLITMETFYSMSAAVSAKCFTTVMQTSKTLGPCERRSLASQNSVEM